jgi:hypothetical protein
MAMAANRVGIVRRAGIVRRVIVNKVVRVVTIAVLLAAVKAVVARGQGPGMRDVMKAGQVAAGGLSKGSLKSSWRS